MSDNTANFILFSSPLLRKIGIVNFYNPKSVILSSSLRNITVLFAVCIVFSVIAPINTAKITSAGTITWGFSKLFLVSRLIFIVIAFISFWINSKNNEEPDYAKMGIYMLVMLAGYGFMITADNFVFMIMGMPLLVYGCVKYLKTLHQIYLWK